MSEETQTHARGEVPELEADKAAREARKLAKRAYEILHRAKSVNGLTPGEKLHGLAHLEDVKHFVGKMSSVISRLESLLK